MSAREAKQGASPPGCEPDPVRKAAAILDQLLEFTRQIGAWECDAGISLPALAKSCGERAQALGRVLPAALGKGGPSGDRSPEKAAILEKIGELQSRIALCTPFLERRMLELSEERLVLSRSRKALRAYAAKIPRRRRAIIG